MTPADLIRDARRSARLTQAQLARRMGTTQPVIARLERPGANPTLETVDRAMRATGRRLKLVSEPAPPSVDESLIRKHLELSPADRIAGLETMSREASAIATAGARARGDVD